MEMNFNFLDTLNNLDSLSDKRTNVWPFVQSPIFAFVCIGLYLLSVVVGPIIMKNKQPFNLRIAIIVYNFFLVIWSAYMCLLFIRFAVFNKDFNFLCSLVDYSDSYESMMLAWAVYLYYISKLVELMDTVFFILRKKNNQITFLHVYHHATMPILFWFGVKYVAGGEVYLSPMVNCFVHVCMYAYYALSAFGPWIQPYLWWKKYITLIQMVQFVIVITKTVFTLVTNCSYPNQFLWGQLFYMLSLLLLFLDFYRQAYKHKRSERTNRKEQLANGTSYANNATDDQNIATVRRR